MSQALYRKWRPHLWSEVIGQDHIVQTLQNAIRSDRVGHAYLFAGPRGTGKTTTARLLAKAVNCLEADISKRPCDHCDHCKAVNDGRFLDLIEIDAASNTSVDDVRSLRDKINFAPTQGRFKVYIIDEVHMLSTAAFNALLKTLEEPPAHAIFILATTEVHKIPATVLSRCQRHEFRRIPVNHIVIHLKNLCEQENLNVASDALVLIARQATGSMRDAISLLDQLTSTGEPVSLESAQQVLGTATSQLVVDLVEAILNRRADLGLNCVHQALDSGSDARQFARQMVEYLRGLLLIRMSNAEQVETTMELRQMMSRQAAATDVPRLVEAIRLFNYAASETRGGWQPGLLLELALAGAVEEKASQVAAVSAQVQTTAVTPKPVHREEIPQPARQRPVEQAQPPASKPSLASQAAVARSDPSAAKSASQPAVPPAAASPEQEAGVISFHDVVQNWGRVRALVKKQRFQTEGLMNSCKLLAIKDGALVLGLQNELLKSKIETNDNLHLIRQSIAQVLGVELPVICVVMTNKVTNPTGHDPDIEGDGIVGTALNLGGHIVQKE